MEEISKEDLKHSRHMCYLLRHKPEEKGLDMDDQGWVSQFDLATAIGTTTYDVGRIACQDPKGRYELDDTTKMIRCINGHSCGVTLELPIARPPAFLYHGTTTLAAGKIKSEGLKKMRRSTVHLTDDVDVAKAVGKRHKGELHLYKVDACRMHADGHEFQKGPKGLWFIDHVPVEYLSTVE